ncbi:MAG: sigma 54-interacting transcriptional regulator [Candidatus Zixiibacteriota bacterium]
MQSKPDSQIYLFEKKISENNLAQAWRTHRIDNNEPCFVKVPSPDSTLPHSEILSLLSKSFTCQKTLKTSRVLTARRRHLEKDSVRIEYPYLDPERWQVLTPELFFRFWPESLYQICLITDLLHHRGLVHLDLKMENFQVRLSGDKPFVILTDLDFLALSGTSLNAKILGTPEHIAPEILNNDIVTAQTDNFSLGKSFDKIKDEQTRDTAGIAEKDNNSFGRLIKTLTAENCIDRPYSLLDALKEFDLVTPDRYPSLKKEVLTNLLLGSFRNLHPSREAVNGWLSSFLLDENRLFGIPEELIVELEQSYRASRAPIFRIFIDLIEKGSLENYGDFWQFKTTDRHLLETMKNLDRLNGTEDEPPAAENGSALKRYLYLKNRFPVNGTKSDNINPDNREKDLKELSRLALDLNRNEDAIAFIEQYLSSIEPDHPEYFQWTRELALQITLSGRQAEALAFIDEGIEKARVHEVLEGELELLNLKTYLKSLQGKHSEAGVMIDDIIKRASAAKLEKIVSQAYYNKYGLEFYQGHNQEAEKAALKSIEIAKKTNNHNILTSSYSSLSGQYQETGEYHKAIKYANRVIKMLKDSKKERFQLPYLFAYLSSAYARLGDFKNAEHYLNQFLAGKAVKFNREAYLQYSLMKGWLELNRGQFQTARKTLTNISTIARSFQVEKFIGRIYYNLAELNLFQGREDECREYIVKGAELAGKLDDKSSLAEYRLLALVNNFYNSDLQTEDLLAREFLEVLEDLTRYNCRHYAASCFFHIVLHHDESTFEKALETIKPLIGFFEDSKAPMFQTVSDLIAYRRQEPSSSEKKVRYLKDAFQSVEAGGQKFHAMILCRKIGQYYLGSSQKLGRKFLLQALAIARQIKNDRYQEIFKRQLDTIPDKDYAQDQLLKALLGISNILRDMENYENALFKVVEFTVNETGAERGVLLLKVEGSDDLQVKSYYNCDTESLKDITDFSKSVVSTVAREVTPLVVSDALEDKRTKKYKSIAQHNIRSVICMPIIAEGTFYGVLYLDHHTIPALFGTYDITFVTSLTNFMSVILNVLKRFKTVTISRDRYEKELTSHGLVGPFITRSKTMEAMFEILPQIAQSNASVLITGESGTGKEIISQMIHNLSPRLNAPYVKMNCAAIADTLIDSELFGVEKNVATGVDARMGKFEAADGGTLFMDEIGDLPLNIQAKVLRVLEYQEFERVGSQRILYADVRFIYATNKDLNQLSEENKFRKDLLHRINTIILEIPPLRERPEDIEPLINYYRTLFAPDETRQPHYTSTALKALSLYHWPGNVRELKNLVDRHHILFPGEQIDVDDLPHYIRQATKSRSHSKSHAEALEKAKIKETLMEFNWNQSKAAQSLGMPLTTFRRKIEKYKISKGK